MTKIQLQQTQQKKLGSQQIQLINMLQQSQAHLEQKIDEELTDNPALEEEAVTNDEEEVRTHLFQESSTPVFGQRYSKGVDEVMQAQTSDALSPHEEVLRHFYFLQLGDTANRIAEHLVGSLTKEGYIPHPLEEMAEEISILYDEEVSVPQVTEVLNQLKKLGPAGFGASSLRECLLAQLQRKEPTRQVRQAIEVIEHHFEAFIKKHYDKIATQLGTSLDKLKATVATIKKLDPMPMALSPNTPSTLEPHFEVKVDQGRTTVVMIEKKRRKLAVSRNYQYLLKEHKAQNNTTSKEVITFIRDKINPAKWFIQALEKRKHTLLKIMEAIVRLQRTFFETGDKTTLKPIFLRHVAEQIGMDISTVSRAIHQKAVQANGHVYPLKYFFSEAIATTDGKEVSSHVIKSVLQQTIDRENKRNPYRDADLMLRLNQKGYVIARRTIAKYREQLGVPVARLRKEIV